MSILANVIPFSKREIEGSIVHRFERVARSSPESVAVRSEAGTWTFAAIDLESNRVAQALLGLRETEQAGEPILLHFGFDPSAIIAMLGVLKAGLAYVALDTAFPTDRNDLILDDCGARIVLTSEPWASDAKKFAGSQATVLNIDHLPPDTPDHRPSQELRPDDLAFIVYTSGATGRPKGVMQNHRNILHRAWVYGNTARISPADRLALFYSPSASGSTRDIYGALLNGASLCPYDLRRFGLAGLPEWLRAERVTVYNSVASVFRHLASTLNGSEDLPDLRLVQLGSETVYKSDAELFQRLFPRTCTFVARLGSSEISPICKFEVRHDTPLEHATVPAGFATEDVEVLILDDEGRALPTGEVGEIVVKSRYLTPGYWGQPDVNRRLFLPDPEGSGARLFRTGDLGVVGNDGCLVHMGRKDFQVKVRGYRVEVTEIEYALLRLPAVREAAVRAFERGSGDKYLVGYIALSATTTHSAGELRQQLKRSLPDHLIPSHFELLESLPKTPSGKIDRNALAEPTEAGTSQSDYVEPRSEVEEALARIWERLFQVRPIGVNDNFFDLGGHSLLAATLLSHVERQFEKRLAVSSLITAPTIATLARLIEQGSVDKETASELRWILPFNPHGSRPALICVHGFAGSVFFFRHVSRILGSEQPVFGIQSRVLDGEPILERSVEEIVAKYVEEVNKARPDGPLVLTAHCAGGRLAYEMAQQLRHGGREVAELILLDLPTPSVRAIMRKESSIKGRVSDKLRSEGLLGLVTWAPRALGSGLHRWLVRKPVNHLVSFVGQVLARQDGRIPTFLRKQYAIERYLDITRRYVPEPYPGSLAVVRSIESRASSAPTDLGWSEYARGGVRVFDVDVSHGDMVTEANVSPEALSHVFEECIEAVHHREQRTPDASAMVRD